MPRVIVFGASGFIGQAVTEALDHAGHTVIGVGLGERPARVDDWIEMDLEASDPAEIARTMREAGGPVVNCTGAVAGTTSRLAALNAGLTARLIEAATAARVDRFVQIGSAAEYGPGPEGVPVRENVCPRPVSDYGASKLAATDLVVAASERDDLDGVVLRVFNPLGRQMPPATLAGAAVQRFREAVAVGASTVEMGPLGAVRDFVDLRDVARAVSAACVVPRPAPRIVNIGSGEGHTARDLVRLLALRLGFDGEIAERAPGSPRSSEVPWQVADIALAAERLGWRPSHDLASSVEEIVAG